MADLLSKHKWFFWISENSKNKQKKKKNTTPKAFCIVLLKSKRKIKAKDIS